jgi:hypothetical protein
MFKKAVILLFLLAISVAPVLADGPSPSSRGEGESVGEEIKSEKEVSEPKVIQEVNDTALEGTGNLPAGERSEVGSESEAEKSAPALGLEAKVTWRAYNTVLPYFWWPWQHCAYAYASSYSTSRIYYIDVIHDFYYGNFWYWLEHHYRYAYNSQFAGGYTNYIWCAGQANYWDSIGDHFFYNNGYYWNPITWSWIYW